MSNKDPQKINFGAYSIDVYLNQPLAVDMYGGYSADRRQIALSGEYGTVDQVDTLLHELTHMIVNIHHLNVDEKLEEEIAKHIGSGMAEIFIRNPWVLKWLLRQMKEINNVD